MKICFIDESGDLGKLENPPQPNNQPVLVIGGLFVDARNLANITQEFLQLKSRFFPKLHRRSDKYLDLILHEVKGSYLREATTRGNEKRDRNAIGFLDHIFGLLRRHHIKIVARIWIKALGEPVNGTAVYTSSIQRICDYFEHYLVTEGSAGFCIADSRNKSKNSSVSHSVFTQKFGTANRYQHLIELPTFGHSDNHAGLQICDIICSALLYPIACRVYCAEHVDNVHVQPRADHLRCRYGLQLKDLQHRYSNPETNRYDSGVVVSDAANRRSGSLMFQPPKATES